MKVPVLWIAVLTYRNAWRVAQAMPILLILGLLICLIEAVIADKVGRESALLRFAINLVGSLLACGLFTPFLIAVQRFILVDEIATAYRTDVHHPRFQKYFASSATLVLLFHSALLGDLVLEPGRSALFLLIVWAGYFVVVVKVTLLFPAIAVDAAGAQWSIAMRASRGSFWRIVGVYVCVLVPIVPLMAISLAIETVRGAAASDLLNLAGGVTIGLTNFIAQLTWAIAASHLFRILEDKMRINPIAGGSTTVGR